MEERRNLILSIIDDMGEVSLADLSDRFPDVSLMTIRRDMNRLEQEGYILRTHGGAISLKKKISSEENEYFLRAAANVEAKKIIAQKALPLVEHGTSIYFDAGSTIMCLAEIIPNKTLSIMTNGTNVAQQLVGNSNISVMIPGGTVNRNTLSVSGFETMNYIDHINIELAFMSASAFTLESGFSVSNVYEAELKRKVISRAKKTIMLMDSSKIGKNLLFTLSDLKDIDVLITEKELDEDIKRACAENNVSLL